MRCLVATTTNSRPQLILPRGLIFLAALWFAASLLLAMGLRTPVHATAASLEPGIRLMLQFVTLGLMIGWPLLRLSQPPTPLPAKQTLLDLLTLATLLQIIVWVPRVFTVWTVSRTAAIDAMLLAWMAMIGAIIASAIKPSQRSTSGHPAVRAIAMTACVALTLLGPLLVLLGASWTSVRSNLVAVGPFMGIASLAAGGATPASPTQWQAIAVIASAAGLCWLALGLMSIGRGQAGVRTLDARSAPAGESNASG